MRMLSPAQRHRARILQQQAQAADPYGTELQGDQYNLMRVKLSQDRAQLSKIQSHERRAEAKAKLLPEYFDWIKTALETGTGAADRVLTTVMVWAFDAGAYVLGLAIAKYVIGHRMSMTEDEYKRTPAAIVIDELSNAFLKGQWSPLDVQAAGDDGTLQLLPTFPEAEPAKLQQHAAALLIEADMLTTEQDAPDQARAKLHKAIAYALLGKVQTAEEPDLATLDAEVLRTALARLQRALQLDSNAGVKKDIERIERVLAKADKPDAGAAAAPAAADAPTTDAAPQPATAAPAAARKTAKAEKPAATPRPKRGAK
ncbi:phage terminase small subunit [uncultured Pseudacidovorax sp.]|uniref:phage terminase small subunit n=1 Tax=uncultured Pseudacidovorax sp. TaxID=679313 RepID=UPI0025FB81BD|nr:phage terminase small subunit [uncultured Pseudacidovorax sp.]